MPDQSLAAALGAPPAGRRLEPVATESGEAREKTSPGKKEKKAKGRLKKPIIIFVVVLLVGFVAKGKIVKPHYGPGAKVPSGQIVELQTEGGTATITTNLSDGHLAQLGISLQLSAAGSTKMINTKEDELMGSTIQLLGQQTYSSLLGPSGRAALSSALLRTYQSELGLNEGAQQVTAVYFTSFVLQ